MATGYIATDHPTLLKFLDSKNYKYELIGGNMTAVELRYDFDLFYLGVMYGQFLEEEKKIALENDLYEHSAE
jgi:hypothetical protein